MVSVPTEMSNILSHRLLFRGTLFRLRIARSSWCKPPERPASVLHLALVGMHVEGGLSLHLLNEHNKFDFRNHESRCRPKSLSGSWGIKGREEDGQLLKAQPESC